MIKVKKPGVPCLKLSWFFVVVGRSRLGFRGDGSRSTIPLDLHDSFVRRNVHHSLRSSSAVRRHQTNRYGVLVRRPTTVSSAWRFVGNTRVESTALCHWKRQKSASYFLIATAFLFIDFTLISVGWKIAPATPGNGLSSFLLHTSLARSLIAYCLEKYFI